MTGHAKLAPSKASRWFACPGSIRLESQCPETVSEYAAEGTAAHALGEKAIRAGYDDTFNYLGETLNGFEVTSEMASAVQVYVDAVSAIAPSADLKSQHAIRWIEQGFKLDWVHPDVWGTADCIVFRPFKHTLDVIDYKHGRGVVVNPERNAQLMIYALGALYNIWMSQSAVTRKALSIYEIAGDVTLWIVQPRADHPGGPIRSWKTSTRELYHFGATQLAICAKATEDEAAPLRAGEHCRFCKAIAVCPARVKENLAIAQTDFDRPVLPEPASLTSEQIIRVLDTAKTLSDWAGQVKAFALAEMERGRALPGYKLVQRKANRIWKASADVIDQLTLLIGDRAFKKPELITVAQAEKEAKARGISLDELAPLWEKPMTGVTIAEDTDSRKSLEASAVDDFNNDFLE
jgi:hypothetical protein